MERCGYSSALVTVNVTGPKTKTNRIPNLCCTPAKCFYNKTSRVNESTENAGVAFAKGAKVRN